jgi:hypothetical protein
MTAAMPDSIEKWSSLLDDSREALLGVVQTAQYGEAALAHATAGRMVAAWTLTPAPVDPVAHVEAQHADSRLHLARLLDQSADAEVVAPMTEQLFDRLTRPVSDPTPIDYRSVTRYTYTPRKPLRRVLDHALDHLNQIDQWQRWRRDGVAPTPTDGWVPSTVTLAEDRLPLTAADLDGWLWRIDQATRLLVQRAAGLANDALDWQPRTEDGRCAAFSTTWRARNCCTRGRSARHCLATPPRATPRRTRVYSRACATPPRVPTPPSYTRTCTGPSSVPPKSWAKCWPSSGSFGNGKHP